MRITSALLKPQTKRGCIVQFTHEMVGILTTLNICKNDKALEWVMKSLALADMDLLEHWDDIECIVYQENSKDILCCKLMTTKRLENFWDIPEGGEYPHYTWGSAR